MAAATSTANPGTTNGTDNGTDTAARRRVPLRHTSQPRSSTGTSHQRSSISNTPTGMGDVFDSAPHLRHHSSPIDATSECHYSRTGEWRGGIKGGREW